ncbi:MAG: hypothetical protein AAF735_07035 [Myxococcota bacterium]
MFRGEEEYSEFVHVRVPDSTPIESGVVQLIDLSPGEADWRTPDWGLNRLFEDTADWVRRASNSGDTGSHIRTEPSLLLLRDGAGRELYTDPDGVDQAKHSEAMGESAIRQDPRLAERIDSIARNPDAQARQSELSALLEDQYDQTIDEALAALRRQFGEDVVETARSLAVEFGKDAVLTALTGGIWEPVELGAEITQLGTAAFSAHHHYELTRTARRSIADTEYSEEERAQIAKSALGANARLAADVVQIAGFLGQIGLTKLAVESGKLVSRPARATAVPGVRTRPRVDATTPPRSSPGSDAELDTVPPASGRSVERVDAVQPEIPRLEFGDHDLVFGPSAGGRLRGLQQEAGGRLLTDLPKPPNLSWVDFSLGVLRSHLDDAGVVRFDLTHMRDIPDALRGVGEYADTVTAHELRFLRDAMDSYPGQVRFYRDGAEVEPPW